MLMSICSHTILHTLKLVVLEPPWVRSLPSLVFRKMLDQSLYTRSAQPAAFDKNFCGLAHVI